MVKLSNIQGSTDSQSYAVPSPCCENRVGRSAGEQALSWRCASRTSVLQVQAYSATPASPVCYSCHFWSFIPDIPPFSATPLASLLPQAGHHNSAWGSRGSLLPCSTTTQG